MFANLLKFDQNHDKLGRFATTNSGGAVIEGYNIKPLSALDKQIIDFKPDRSLSDPKAIRPIEKVIPNAKFVPYSEVPFFDALNKLIGVDPRKAPMEKYSKARAKFFASCPIKDIKLDDIVVTQQMVNKEKVAKLVEQDDPSSKPIAAVRYKHKTYIMDGHHRTVAAVLRGDTSIEGHMHGWVINLDKKKYRAKFKDILKIEKCL